MDCGPSLPGKRPDRAEASPGCRVNQNPSKKPSFRSKPAKPIEKHGGLGKLDLKAKDIGTRPAHSTAFAGTKRGSGAPQFWFGC
jgi:hypothetical protein